MSAAMEWLGAFFGLIGAFLLALSRDYSRLGWWASLVANLCLIGFAASDNAYGLLTQQLGFTIASCLGIWRSYGTQRRNADPPPSCSRTHTRNGLPTTRSSAISNSEVLATGFSWALAIFFAAAFLL